MSGRTQKQQEPARIVYTVSLASEHPAGEDDWFYRDSECADPDEAATLGAERAYDDWAHSEPGDEYPMDLRVTWKDADGNACTKMVTVGLEFSPGFYIQEAGDAGSGGGG